MKQNISKLLMVVALIVISATDLFADKVSFDATSPNDQSSTLSFTKSGITISVSSGTLSNGTDYRCYKGATFTISSTVGSITSVKFTSTNPSYAGYITLSGNTPGSLSTSNSITTWSYSNGATELVFTGKNGNSNEQIRATAIEVTYTASATTYTITAQSNNTNYGTVSLNGSVITGAPKSGCRYASPAYSVDPANSATVSQNGNAFTVTPSANTTVTIIFEAIPTHTVTFSVNGNTSTQDYAEDAAISFPSPSKINGKTCVGWTTSTITGTTNTAPDPLVSSATMGNSDITYYAVFADVETSVSETETETSQTLQYDTWSYDGTTTDKTSYRLFAENAYIESASFDLSLLKEVDVYAGTFGTISDSNKKKVSVVAGQTIWGTASLSTKDAATKNTITSSVSLSGNGQLHIVAGGGDGSNNGIRISKVDIITKKVTNTCSNYCTTVVLPNVETPEILVAEQFSISTPVEITCNTNDATIYYTTNGDDPTSSSTEYTGSFNITSTTTIKAIAIKGDDESSIASATSTKVLADPTVTIDASGLYNRNLYLGSVAGKLSASVIYNNAAVDGATVSWSVDDDKVATIDENTGAVTLKKAGSVTFIATFEETSDYSEQMAEFELTVIDADPSIATITFGSADGSTKIDSKSVYGNDSNGNTWSISTVISQSSFTQNSGYSQVGSSSKPATSITFTTAFSEDVRITSFKAKFGGFSGTAGTVTLKVDNSSVGTGSLNADNDVTVESSSSATGKTLTVTVTGISKGVKCYYISYTVESVNAVPSESRFWSSFYNSSKSYKLPLGAQAFTMHSDNRLYLLGEDGSIIPAGTAVIIISDKASNALVECTTSISDSANILVGSDTAISTPAGKVAYVLGIAGSPAKIGFYKYEGNTIPGGKAFILVNE